MASQTGAGEHPWSLLRTDGCGRKMSAKDSLGEDETSLLRHRISVRRKSSLFRHSSESRAVTQSFKMASVGASEMAHWVKVLATQPDDLSAPSPGPTQ